MASQTSVFKTMAQDATLTGGGLRGVTGPLVKIPLDSAKLASSVSGGGTATYSAGGTGLNPDGSSSTLSLSVTAVLPGMAVTRTNIYGRVVGVRWRRLVAATAFPFDVVIDGVAYAVENVVPRRDNQSSSTITDYESLRIIATDLADSMHTVEVHVVPDPALVQTNTLVLLGFVGERGKGYNEVSPVPRGGFIAATTLTASAASISFVGPVAGLSFHNTDVASRTVTVYGPDGTTIYRVLTIAAGADSTVLFPSPRILSGWKWKADAASVVTGWVENA